jgi:hypothetical protein
MSKGSKWRKTDYKRYWGNWPKSMGPKKERLLTPEEALEKILETAKKRPGFLIL